MAQSKLRGPIIFHLNFNGTRVPLYLGTENPQRVEDRLEEAKAAINQLTGVQSPTDLRTRAMTIFGQHGFVRVEV